MNALPPGSAGSRGVLRRLKGPFVFLGKQLLHRTLLRFPGGDSHDPIACAYCPEMCRFSCPTAVTSGNDAVTPCNKMSLLHKEARWPGQVAQGGPLWPIYDCTGCGRCTEYCVYGMPVADMLFEARKEFGWDRAKTVATEISDHQDPIGDLADELGDSINSSRRMAQYISTHGEVLKVSEPRHAYFLTRKGYLTSLGWETSLDASALKSWVPTLKGKRWLLHESVWLSRRLERATQIAAWVEHARAQAIDIVAPFQHGKDCIDCGGEGAYSRLFPGQAARMASEIWERDAHRADGILCFSNRCADHLRRSLGAEVPIVSLAEEPWRK